MEGGEGEVRGSPGRPRARDGSGVAQGSRQGSARRQQVPGPRTRLPERVGLGCAELTQLFQWGWSSRDTFGVGWWGS